ncbi:hypothetical protein [Chitinophaga japonensis]|nr:hypothetical protein [Chitinophaga japonensis]
MDDLIVIPCSHVFSIEQLVNMISYRDFQFCPTAMEKEYDMLYAVDRHKGMDFFRVKGTEVVVMPGTYIYPTIFNEEDIRSGVNLLAKAAKQ